MDPRWQFACGQVGVGSVKRFSATEAEVDRACEEHDSAIGSGLCGRVVMKIRADGALVSYDITGKIERIIYKKGKTEVANDRARA